jgi:hypothetical protein
LDRERLDLTEHLFYSRHVTAAFSTAVAHSLEDDFVGGAPFRLVLARDKRDRLAARAAHLSWRRACSVSGCSAEGMPVLLVEAEIEAILCPVHELVRPDGSVVEGQPMLATAAW